MNKTSLPVWIAMFVCLIALAAGPEGADGRRHAQPQEPLPVAGPVRLPSAARQSATAQSATTQPATPQSDISQSAGADAPNTLGVDRRRQPAVARTDRLEQQLLERRAAQAANAAQQPPA